jgi:hypothetical protein
MESVILIRNSHLHLMYKNRNFIQHKHFIQILHNKLRLTVIGQEIFLDFFTVEDATDMLSRNVGTALPLNGA